MHWLSHRIALLRKLESATKLFTSGKRVLANSICVIKPWLRIRRHMVVNSRGHFCKILKIRSTILPSCSVLHYPSPGINQPHPNPSPSPNIHHSQLRTTDLSIKQQISKFHRNTHIRQLQRTRCVGNLAIEKLRMQHTTTFRPRYFQPLPCTYMYLHSHVKSMVKMHADFC